MKPADLEPLTEAQTRNLLAIMELQRQTGKAVGYPRLAARLGIAQTAVKQSAAIIARKGYILQKEGGKGPDAGSLSVEFTPERTRFDVRREHATWKMEQARKELGALRPGELLGPDDPSPDVEEAVKKAVKKAASLVADEWPEAARKILEHWGLGAKRVRRIKKIT